MEDKQLYKAKSGSAGADDQQALNAKRERLEQLDIRPAVTVYKESP